ncbi:MAG: RNA 2',3'-cyclic phosphodiesterase [Actinomycetota bacterium]|nr:RNA 2',3'-cyclic phosphodiesterase [Actinomycetota bacterium]
MEPVDRIFAATPVPIEVQMALAETLADLDVPGRRVPPDNWHLTVRFLGDIDTVTYERFLVGLEAVSGLGSFTIELDGLGAFPKQAKATVLWAGLSRGEAELATLNEVAEEAAQGAGLAPEERPYRPHLTLSRIRPPRDVHHLIEEPVSVGWRCRSLVVYRSVPQKGGVKYEPLESFDLS